MTEQLSFLDWQPPPELMQEPLAIAPCEKPSVNAYAIQWWRDRLRYYQRMQKGFCDRAYQSALAGDANAAIQKMRRHETTRLQGFCDECSAKLKELSGEKPSN